MTNDNKPAKSHKHFAGEWRRYRGLSEDAAAKALGLTLDELALIETGAELPYEIAIKMADVYRLNSFAEVAIFNPLDPEQSQALWDRIKAIDD